ncbi:MAG: hypothetical protein ABGZ17_10540 [Planctomycetaceae bacterium]
MTDDTFANLEDLQQNSGAAAAIDALIEGLRSRQEHAQLFEALMLQKRFQLQLPLSRPATLEDVPDALQDEFREAFVAAAREVGQLFLDAGQVPQAWPYFRTIGEFDPVARAIESLAPKAEYDEAQEEIMQIALYEAAHPVKGLELLLHSHGTCNTITALDQQMQQMTSKQRAESAAMIVDHLYDELTQTLRHEVEQRMAVVPPGASIRELIAGRDWLFAEGNYHIDVSHLSSVVRFARSLPLTAPQLAKAIELAEYGARLDSQFQYPGEPPFEDAYESHQHYFKAQSEDDAEKSLQYFRDKLRAEPDLPDQQMIAYVLVDLLLRREKCDEALEVAEEFLKDVDEQVGFSFPDLCREVGRLDVLCRVSRDQGDLVGFTAALVENAS